MRLHHPSPVSLPLLLGLVAALPPGWSRPEKAESVTVSFDSAEVGKLPPNWTTDLTGGGGPAA